MILKIKLFSLFFLLCLISVNAQSNMTFSEMSLLGRSNPKLHSDSIPLLPEVGAAFLKMQAAARKEGIEIEIISAYRSYDRQKGIWNRKYRSNAKQGLNPKQNIKKIIEYSTLPGSSRHHWGTDVDLIDGMQPKFGDVLLTKKFHGKGPYVKMRKWMDAHAVEYGFIRPYTSDDNRKGFYYEPWHYSYAPIAIPMLKAYLELNLNSVLLPEYLQGQKHIDKEFMTRYIQENILGINKILK